MTTECRTPQTIRDILKKKKHPLSDPLTQTHSQKESCPLVHNKQWDGTPTIATQTMIERTALATNRLVRIPDMKNESDSICTSWTNIVSSNSIPNQSLLSEWASQKQNYTFEWNGSAVVLIGVADIVHAISSSTAYEISSVLLKTSGISLHLDTSHNFHMDQQYDLDSSFSEIPYWMSSIGTQSAQCLVTGDTLQRELDRRFSTKRNAFTQEQKISLISRLIHWPEGSSQTGRPNAMSVFLQSARYGEQSKIPLDVSPTRVGLKKGLILEATAHALPLFWICARCVFEMSGNGIRSVSTIEIVRSTQVTTQDLSIEIRADEETETLVRIPIVAMLRVDLPQALIRNLYFASDGDGLTIGVLNCIQHVACRIGMNATAQDGN